MDQSQILLPCPHFIIMLPFMVNFRKKIYFLQEKHQGWTKITLKCIPLETNWISSKKLSFFFGKIYMIFKLFSKWEAWLQNLRPVHDFLIFFGLFDTYNGPGAAFVLKWEILRLKLLVCNRPLETVPLQCFLLQNQQSPVYVVTCHFSRSPDRC